MTRIPTVTLQRKSDGRELTVNTFEYATNLGEFRARGYERVRETGGDEPLEVRTPVRRKRRSRKSDGE